MFRWSRFFLQKAYFNTYTKALGWPFELNISTHGITLYENMDSEKPTNPNGLVITEADLMSYIVGAVQRIESQLASDEPPPWAKKFLMDMDKRITKLETDINGIQTTCKSKHSNGSSKSFI